jgi:hypothetical protein
MSRRKLLGLGLLAVFSFTTLFANNYEYNAPEMMQSAYKPYSQNYPYAETLGKGNTGIAEQGGLAYLTRNPASLKLNSTALKFGFLVKTSTDSMIEEESFRSYRNEPIIGMAMLGFPINDFLTFAASYTQSKSIQMSQIKVFHFTNHATVFEPTYSQHDMALTLSHDAGPFQLGLNFLAEYHSLYEQRNYQSIYANLKDSDVAMRFQPGIRYEYENLSLGLTYKSEGNTDIELLTWKPVNSEEVLTQNYDVTIPMEIAGGISYRHSETLKYNLEAEFIETSAENPANDDLLNLRLGIEKQSGNYFYKLGFMHLPQAYSGNITVPNYEPEIDKYNTQLDSKPGFVTLNPNLTIKENDQEVLTAGFGYDYGYGRFDLALFSDLKSENSPIEIAMTFGFNVSKINKNFRERTWLQGD